MVDQVKAMRSSIPKKQERKPPFFRGGGASAADTEGAEPRASVTRTGLTRQGKANHKVKRGLKTSAFPCITPLPNTNDSNPSRGRQPAGGRKTKRSHEHLEGENKRPVGGRHCQGLSDRFPVRTLSESITSPSTILQRAKLIVEEVQELLGKGAITEVHSPRGGFYSNLFLVPKEGGQRPVINLKALNSFVHTEHFKMEGIHTLRDLVNPEDRLAKVHLKDAYFAIPIHQSHHQYLRFYHQEKCYQFQCLPFGLSSAPWVFTNTLKPALALLREMGVRLIAYIDDMNYIPRHELSENKILSTWLMTQNIVWLTYCIH